MVVVTAILIIIVGLIIGSFLTVVVKRYPMILEQHWRAECQAFLRQEIAEPKSTRFNLFVPRSQCPHCQHTIAIRHNIPLISYLLLKGKCAYCKQKISWHYPTIELLTALSMLIIFIQFSYTIYTPFAWLFTWILIILSFIDIEKRILPDPLTLTLLWVGLITSVIHLFSYPEDAIIGAVIGYLLLWIIAKLYFLVRKKEGMGHGDFKMLAMIGAWLGASVLFNVILTAALLGLCAHFILMVSRKIKHNEPLPFGPWLATAGWLTLIFGPFLTELLTLKI